MSCLYHQKKECTCIQPVTNNKDLIARLKSVIRNDELNSRHMTDGPDKQTFIERISNNQIRLESLESDDRN